MSASFSWMLAPFESDGDRLLPHRVHGEQLLGHSSKHAYLDFVVQLPQAAVPSMVQEFSRDFYLEEAAVRAVYQSPHQFNAIDTRPH